MKKKNSTVELERTLLERMRSTGTPLSKEEMAFLEDMKAYIDFGIKNGITFMVMMGGIAHDVNEIARNGFDFHAALDRGFVPKVSGYSKFSEESIKDAEDE